MPRRRSRLFQKPDTRPRWDDPHLPIRMRTRGMFGQVIHQDISPEYLSALCAMHVERDPMPTYDKDPSYNWRRR